MASEDRTDHHIVDTEESSQIAMSPVISLSEITPSRRRKPSASTCKRAADAIKLAVGGTLLEAVWILPN